ncbi:AGR399Cp [Eremothecium gossypii ATCC 10895]|uniref:DNA replication complex GINS protein PSF3 n=1 Tax=Eremothecium gossypii (strain ATCC 10895 / CBS 109.51 / FGSC 9923 / NRRL Y-1056) TaxID=284811 RepID=PSF3_EREGS|nr:AGR399Cp [Eremothecium gossypii ATCC 10895]Q74Z08.1 RecName: Full=DNA replication complex GINS protein PSF3 [Eremothecium gossypii ATCC 10895]AAS54889.1 AGR399Cp [Eremothecium gossypii ATCC 10895]AEY99221.1 FAGR399Cp [Eremothecium gossypii FDAG1]
MGYYDLDDILADSSKFACRFNYELPGLGYLEGNPGKPVGKHSKVELPLWLASVLATVTGEQEHVDEEALPFVEFLPPEMFSARVVNAIKADAPTLDVHSINGHFYALGTRWAALFSDAGLAGMLAGMVLERALEVQRHAASAAVEATAPTDATARMLQTLDEWERQLYRRAHAASRDAKLWAARR